MIKISYKSKFIETSFILNITETINVEPKTFGQVMNLQRENL